MNRLHSAAYRLGAVLLGTAALLVAFVLLGPAGQAQTKAAAAPDLALVPADATAFVHIRFADLWKSPLVQLLRQSAAGELAKAEVEMEKETGLKLTDLETATLIVLGVRGDENEPPALGAITTIKPYDAKKVISAMKGDVQVQKVGGKSYHVAGGTALHFAGERMIVAGGESAVKRFLEGPPKPAAGKLAPALKLAGENHHVVAGFQIPEQFQQMAQQAPLPPDVEFMKPLAETHSGSIVLDLTNDIRLQVTLSLPSEAKAKQGVLAVQKGLEMARQMLTQMPGELAEAPNWSMMVKPIEAILKSAKVEAQQANVVITMQASGAALIAASLPAVQKIRAAAQRMEGANNLKEIGLAFHNYADTYKQFPPQAITSKDGKPLLSWRVALLPYVNQPDLYKEFKLDEPWDGPNNKKLLAKIPKVYVHPSAKVKDPTHTAYQVFTGKGTVFETGRKVRFADVHDGMSNTILAAEAAEGVPWTKPEDMPFDPKKPLPKLGGHEEKGGFNVLLCDGRVSMIKKDFKEATLRLAIIRNDGTPIDLSEIEEGFVRNGKPPRIFAAAQRLDGANNLKEIGLAFHNYVNDHNQFPPQATAGKDGKPLLSWRVALLPYLNQADLYKEFKLDEPWDGPNNKKLLAKIPKVYVHPSAKVKDPTHTVYQAFNGKGTLFEPGQKLFFTHVTDGTSNTILVAEAAEGVPWTKPEDMAYDPKKPLPKLGGHTEGGFFVVWCDGSIGFIKTKFDEATLRLAITRNDGQPIDRSLIEGP